MKRSIRASLLTTITALIAATVVACSGVAGPAATGTPGTPGPSGDISVVELKLRLLDELGSLWYCDPDSYPVAVDEAGRVEERFPEVLKDREALEAILAHLGIAAAATYSPDDQLAIYRAWKRTNAITLEPTGDGRYVFDLLIEPGPTETRGTNVIGTIDSTGTIEVTGRQPADGPNCPICLTRGTLIDTPHGWIAVEDLREGDPVWTLDGTGRRVEGVVSRVGSSPVPATHRVVHLLLDDGREAWVSPGHPLADGGSVGSVRPGDVVDGARVVSAELIVYEGGRTFDLLPSGPTGLYWAGGILLASTLAD